MGADLDLTAGVKKGQQVFKDGANAVYPGLTPEEEEKSEEAKRKVENQPGIVNEHLASMQTGR